MIPEITRTEALEAFRERHPSLTPEELEHIFSQWLAADALDFVRRPDGRWRMVLCSPPRKQ
jgi:hypothetical protein